MKTLSLLLISLLLLTGCGYQVYTPSFVESQYVITYPQAYPTKVIGVNDTLITDGSLVLVNSFDFDTHPSTSLKDALDSLQKISQDFGYDVVKIKKAGLHSWDESGVTTVEVLLSALAGTELDEETITYSTNRYRIDAYKSVDNMDYLNTLLYSRELFQLSNEGIMAPLGRQYLQANGKQHKISGSKVNFQRLHAFNEEYLLNEQEGWQYRWVNENKMIRKNKTNKVIIHFSGNSANKLPSDILLQSIYDPSRKYNISLFYDQEGKITHKEVLFDGSAYASLRYEFDAIGRISKELIDIHKTGNTYQVLYEYYDSARLTTK
ncbi:MAG: hypothetical protein AAFO69_05920 [Bacteroidota bacterium]